MIIYLYVKQHSKTGMKYFGKTTSQDPYSYTGSGKVWLRHIKKHGKEHIKTLYVWSFDNIQECSDFALRYSTNNNIVESSEWANLIVENGLDGAPAGNIVTPETRIKIAQALTGKSGKTLTERGRATLSHTRSKLNKTNEFKSQRSAEMKTRYETGWINPSKGKFWITNGVDSLLINQAQTIPTGWYRGRVINN